MSVPVPEHLNSHHRDTLLQIFQHPTSHNIEWNDVLSLLEAVGSVEQHHDGKYVVTLGTETEVLTRPKAQGHRCPTSRRSSADVDQCGVSSRRRRT